MECLDFNSNPPQPPVQPFPGRHWVFEDGTDKSIFMDLFNFYHRPKMEYLFQQEPGGGTKIIRGPGPSENDSIVIAGKVLDAVQMQSRVIDLRNEVHGKMTTRARQLLTTLKCDQKGCFTDAGSELVVSDLTEPALNLAFGRFTIYWSVLGEVGPRSCKKPEPACRNKFKSEAHFNCQIKWMMYDRYDFTGAQNLMFLSWTGTDFHTFGFWETVHNGLVYVCE